MKCPICHQPSVKEFAPFCSRHCKNIDLLKWLNEDYSVPVNNPEEEEKTEISPKIDDET
jgi:endogenous inhibitor of DNA gyrase (YacG/DUF329 family)